MVKRLSIFLAYTLFFFLALICFSPKSSLYYYMEHNIKSSDVMISSGGIEEKCFWLKLRDTKLYFKSVESANIKESDIKLFALYNIVKLKNIKLLSVAASFMPLHVEKLEAKYTLLNPLYVEAEAVGEFGYADISINIKERSIHVVLTPSNLMLQNYSKSLKNLSKSKDGDYFYDKNF